MIALSNNLSLPVTAVFGTGPPGKPEIAPTIDRLFSYPLGPAVALFSLLSAAAHFIVVSPWGFPRYARELAAGRNRFRWVEYSVSSSLMIVLVASISGITDAVALIGLFGVNAAMILFGWSMETKSQPGPGADWTPYIFGCIAGVVPWIGVSIYLFGAGSEVPGNELPTFVYVIFVILFVLFNCFAINQLLQYRARGRWANYLFGERVYIWLSLIAKSVLAWQIFVNILID